jgi:UDP-glucose 4-epimerase
MGTYLVTGGCGFIGSHLADALLAAGHSVRILDDLSNGRLANRPEAAELLVGDVTDSQLVAEAMRGIDGCFHLAAVASVERSKQDWLGTHRVNLTGSIAVFAAASRAGEKRPVPVVYASSAAVYRDNPQIPLAETAPVRPLSAYGADKLGAEQHAFVAARTHGVPTCGLRLFNVYGPRQDPSSPYSGVISIFCDSLKAGRRVTIFGDGEQSRDFIFVEDVVLALLAAMKHANIEGPIYNVCTGRSTTVRALAEAVARIIGVQPQVFFDSPRVGEVRVSLGDPSRASRELGFQARTSLEDGLARTIGTV